MGNWVLMAENAKKLQVFSKRPGTFTRFLTKIDLFSSGASPKTSKKLKVAQNHPD
jgi:hypothetical protein